MCSAVFSTTLCVTVTSFVFFKSRFLIYVVSGQGPWSHWHAISTSLDPASLQGWPQYLSPPLTRHRHGKCPHFFCSVAIIDVLLRKAGRTRRLQPQSLGCLVNAQYQTSSLGKLFRIDRLLKKGRAH